ncbi:Rpn family recombination-promoting nuclease/putative transposase [Sedimentibacter hydroxybenzoicus DSM 7310]|uniref:Rpn family recombination-promoting nuclease/putative transposase n=1 Tax=Sedimentibacter hydroxybenzoicus DSM 7310 TaxID=1123245 RepID=A0A974BMY5_SEDHY|nr:Rpn family recombination-promoting nuclease/putative transposase [Sedimentibacter hydroxybenzoicus]NYB75575.1 Rpn family recombination-promoting nuclease/putative transposase [Sedimentibacter hydroxybenzoicus DSM 7310]
MDNEKNKTERIRLDETLKLLFDVSKPLVINIVNYFFNESFDVNQKYDVEFMATESADLNMELRKADLLLKIGGKQKFHFEFQLNGERFMVLRMFDYGYREAVKDTGTEDIPTIYFPKQAVLYLEEGRGIPDELKLKVVYPVTDKGKQEIVYTVNYFSETYADLKLSKEVSEMTEYIYTRGKAEGRAEGIREGKKEGIREGIKEGKAEGILETAAEMLKKGLDIELISEITKLPKEEIKKLQDKINNHNN